MNPPEHLLHPEYNVKLNSDELELLLDDVHYRIFRLTEYLDLNERIARGGIPTQSLARRMARLVNLAAKLEQPLEKQKQETTNERKRQRTDPNRDRDNHPGQGGGVPQVQPGE